MRTKTKVGMRGWLAGAMGALLMAGAPVRGQVPDAAGQVEARERAFARTMAERDLDAFGTFVSDEAVFFNGNEPIRGREAIVAAWAPFFQGQEAPFAWEPDVVTVLASGGLALSSGPVRNAAGEPAGRFNSIWRLEPDGVWRVVFDKGS